MLHYAYITSRSVLLRRPTCAMQMSKRNLSIVVLLRVGYTVTTREG